MSRTAEYVTTRMHIVIVAMCISLLVSESSTKAHYIDQDITSRSHVGVDLAAASIDPDIRYRTLGSIPIAIGSTPTSSHQTIRYGQRIRDVNQAGLLVDYGNGTISWIWVPFADDEITVMSMLEQSDLDLVTVGFGGLGSAVCQIEFTGCGPTECRQRMCQTRSSDPFWRVMRLDGDTWTMTNTGVDGTRVRDGGVVAVSWSATTPELPRVSVEDVAANANVDLGAPPDHAVTRTIGELPDAPEDTYGWWPIAGSVGVVLLVSGGLIVRGRRMQRVAA